MKNLLLAGCVSVDLWFQPAASAAEVDFVRDIFPILERSCLECHGPQKDKGDLRLDLKAHAFATDYVIVPGEPEDSELYFLVTLPPDDPDIMPAEGELLPVAEIALLKQWIEEGAPWVDVLPSVDYATESKPEPNQEKLRDYEITAAESAAIARLRANDVAISRLAQNSNLIKVTFRARSGAPDTRLLQILPDIANLHDLDLSGVDISDQDLSYLGSIPHLQRLNLSATGVSDTGLIHLSGLSDLRTLNLFDTGVSDAGMKHLAALQKLENLYLWKTKVTAAGVSHLEQLLPRLKANTGFDIMPNVEPASKEMTDDEGRGEVEAAGD